MMKCESSKSQSKYYKYHNFKSIEDWFIYKPTQIVPNSKAEVYIPKYITLRDNKEYFVKTISYTIINNYGFYNKKIRIFTVEIPKEIESFNIKGHMRLVTGNKEKTIKALHLSKNYCLPPREYHPNPVIIEIYQ